ncbi:MAG: hypothetical protein U0230_25800 [Polyangiales bacterium]
MPPVHLLEAEAERLKKQIGICETDWARIPRLFYTCLVGIPVSFVWGLVWGTVAVVIALAFVGTSAYLIGVRRREYQRDLVDVEQQLALARRQAG